jgi:hypothetical protein
MKFPPHGVEGQDPQVQNDPSSVRRPEIDRASAAQRAPVLLASVLGAVSIEASDAAS